MRQLWVTKAADWAVQRQKNAIKHQASKVESQIKRYIFGARNQRSPSVLRSIWNEGWNTEIYKLVPRMWVLGRQRCRRRRIRPHSRRPGTPGNTQGWQRCSPLSKGRPSRPWTQPRGRWFPCWNVNTLFIHSRPQNRFQNISTVVQYLRSIYPKIRK